MKIFIRTLEFGSEIEKDKYRLILNNLGFYCLSRGTDLEVYAIKELSEFEKVLQDFIGG